MNVVFRVDAAPKLGGGHLSRCMTLASYLKRYGVKCIFVMRDHVGSLIQHVTQSDFQLILLPRNYDFEIDTESYVTWVGETWRVDSIQTYNEANKLLSGNIDWVIVDHYGLDLRWECFFSSKGIKVGVIDDLVNRAHNADFLLDQTCGRDKAEYQHLTNPGAELFVGERYCLLRPEFYFFREKAIKKRKSFKSTEKLLVNFGSTDPTGHTLQAINGLSYFANVHKIEVHVLIGSACPYLGQIKQLVKNATYKVVLHVDSQKVGELITDVDLAIGAAGVSTWERCFLGLPTLLVKTAENQNDVVKRVVSSGAALFYSQCLANGKLLADALSELEKKHDLIVGSALQMKIGDDLEALMSLIFEGR